MIKRVTFLLLLISHGLAAQFSVDILKDINLVDESLFAAPRLYHFENTTFEDRLFISVDDRVHGRELWQSDGTEEGTKLQIEFVPGPEGVDIIDLLASDSALFIVTEREDNTRNYWRSDGTQAGIRDLGMVSNGNVAVLNDTLYRFSSFNTFKSDGQGDWFLFSDVVADGDPILFRDKLYFMGRIPTQNPGLWVTDGSMEGTMMVKSLPSAPVTGAAIVKEIIDDHLYMVLNDGVHGYELWRSDGTEAGTQLIRDIVVGPEGTFTSQEANAIHLTPYNGEVYFAVRDLIEGDLWKTDGTEDGTIPVADIYNQLSNANPSHFSLLNDRLYFLAQSNLDTKDLWVTTGSTDPDSTYLVYDLPDDPAGNIGTTPLVSHEGLLFLRTSNRLWWSDGFNVEQISPRLNSISYQVFNNDLYFVADESTTGWEVWKIEVDLLSQINTTDTICFGSTDGEINIQMLNGQGPYTYTWNESNLSGPQQDGLAAGVYICTITDVDGDSRIDTITINEWEELNATVMSNPASGNNADGSVTLIIDGGQAPYTYLWNTDPTQTTSTASNLPAGDYTYEVFDANGCILTGMVTIDMQTSTQNLLANSSFSISPNPNDGNFSLQWDTGTIESLQLSLYDLQGREWQSLQLSVSGRESIFWSDLPIGIYYLKLSIGDEYWKTERLVILP